MRTSKHYGTLLWCYDANSGDDVWQKAPRALLFLESTSGKNRVRVRSVYMTTSLTPQLLWYNESELKNVRNRLTVIL